jgi:hypothetical protein
MAKPTVFVGNEPMTAAGNGDDSPDRPQAKRPLAPSGDSSGSMDAAAAAAEGDAPAASTVPKGGLKRPSKKTAGGAAGGGAAAAASALAAAADGSGGVLESAGSPHASRFTAARAGALLAALFSRAALAYLLPVCLGLLLGLSALRARHGGTWAPLFAAGDSSCANSAAYLSAGSGSEADDAARARLLAKLGGSGGAVADARLFESDLVGSGGGAFSLLTSAPFFVLLFVARLLLALPGRLLKNKPKSSAGTAPAGSADGAGDPSPEAAAAAGAGADASGGDAPLDVAALLGGGLLGSVAGLLGPYMASGGPLAWLGHLLSAYALAKELAGDFAALLFVALGVCGLGPALARGAAPWLAAAGVLDASALGTCA